MTGSPPRVLFARVLPCRAPVPPTDDGTGGASAAGVPSAVVVVAGATGSGKTTLARHLASRNGLRAVSASAVLLDTSGGDRGKDQRLQSWLDPQPATASRRALVAEDRLTDLSLVAVCADPCEDLVVETAGQLALLLPVHNASLLVLVDAATAVRAERIRRRLALRVTGADALRIVMGKDNATAAAARAAWALETADLSAAAWRFDLVIRCPDLERCRSTRRCACAAVELARAAVAVYRCYLAGEPATAAVAGLMAAADRWRPWVVRLTPALRNRTGPHTAGRWRDRRRAELETPGAVPAGGSGDGDDG